MTHHPHNQAPTPDPEDLLARLPAAHLPTGADQRIATAIRAAAPPTQRAQTPLWRKPIPAWQALAATLIAAGAGITSARLAAPTQPPPQPPIPANTTTEPAPTHQSSFIPLTLAQREPQRHTADISNWSVISTTHHHKGSDQ